jgi:hypothetical protein
MIYGIQYIIFLALHLKLEVLIIKYSSVIQWGSKLAFAGTHLIENLLAHGASNQWICRNNCEEYFH